MEEDWRGSRNKTWQERMDNLSANIRDWVKQHRSPQNRLDEAQSSLYQNQMLHPSYQNHNLEEQCLHEIDKAEKEIEKYWTQRAKLNWTCLGDRNTAFFHATATNRRRYNMVLKIMDEQGNWIMDDSQIR